LRKGTLDYERAGKSTGDRKNSSTCHPTSLEVEDATRGPWPRTPDNGDIMSAVVLEASPKLIIAMRLNSEKVTITGEGLRPAQSGLADKVN
jgi:penicillin-binding protein 1A